MEGLVDPFLGSFWRGRRVLLTGHTGFKGSWLSLWLQHLGADLLGFALAPPSTPSLFQAARVAGGMRSIHGDIRDLPQLQRAFSQFQPEIVFHLAAQPLVRSSYNDPLETFATNVQGTANVLQCLRAVPAARAAVVVTSDKCYQNQGVLRAYQETDPLGGHDPYSASKACAEIVAACYRSSFLQARGVAVATVRAGNVIGGGDWALDRLVPDALRCFGEKELLSIRHPHALRPWQHVLEPLGGYLMLARRLLEEGQPFAEAWNFGPQSDAVQPVSWIVQWLAEAWGPGARWQVDTAVHPHEAAILTLDSSKAANRLGWTPRLRLPAALALTLNWHQLFLAGGDMRQACLDQVESFLAVP